jgi:WD40 repeat protein
MEVDNPAAVPTLDGVLLTTSGGSTTTLLRHATKVTALVVCAGHVFCGDEDGEVRGWTLHSLQAFVTSGTPHVGAVFALEAFAMDEPLLFSAAADGLLAWDVMSRQCRGSLQGHTSAVIGLAISQGLVASGSTDGELRFWEPVSRRCVADVAAHSAPIQALAAVQHGLLASACRGGHVHLWRVEDQERHSTSRSERVAVRVAPHDAHGGDWITCLAPLWPEAQAGSGWQLEPAGSRTGSPLGRGWLREPQPPANPCAHTRCMPHAARRTRGLEARPSGRDPSPPWQGERTRRVPAARERGHRRARGADPDPNPNPNPDPLLSPDLSPSSDPTSARCCGGPGWVACASGGPRVWRGTRSPSVASVRCAARVAAPHCSPLPTGAARCAFGS